MDLSYAEIDSLMMIQYELGDFNEAISFAQAIREKARAEFGEQDFASCKKCVKWLGPRFL